ncbi:3'(2'),5'-bisphosphate nucleotidase CysQ [Actinomadura viridis]|uniref:inositol-phosphate phosphatase n=1 Tax=Actinomadura viridis TaxID=58110 RepID=A0A931GP66_9ACTN|nr:3'(2'),5'-bisphosphate nucleotidase CysQ [Actinomadura viridis]MBG6087094.1 3'(2'), 5'-bisphosphate nucleotidase [Actinomadura viridis]
MVEREGAGSGAPEGDHALAGELAGRAGSLLLDVREELGFSDVRALKDTGDLRAHEYLMDALARRRPGDAVLSEEGRASVAAKSATAVAMDGPPTGNTDESVRLSASRVWIIDPLDGTREFAEEGRRDWAVHVALWEAAGEGRLAAGAVALPAQGLTLRTAPEGAVVAGTGEDGRPSERPLRLTPPAAGRLRIAVSRSRPPEFLRALAGRLGEAGTEVELVPIGSAGAKIAAVMLGEVDAYVHAGGQYEWDSAAPVAVALAAGAHASRIDGATLAYNEKDPRLPDIVVCHPESASTLLTGIRDVTAAPPG